MRFTPLVISIFLLFKVVPVIGQNCGCADDENCPVTFTPNSTTTICYDVEDAFNDDLSDPAQGVCGVSVYFEDDEIGSLNLSLIAPNGTTVQLTGTTGNCNNWTLISTWDILFIPCTETCVPDTINGCELPCTFDNCPTDCLWPNAMMTGSYLPYSGCLEDFNSGPVNGQWCIEIENNASFQGGTMFDFEVILCDQSGFTCCDADAGNLAFEPDVNACEGDSALALTLNPLYGAVVPDTGSYGYTYTVFSNGNLLALDTLTDLRTYPMGTYQICGLSYLLMDSLQLPTVGTSLSAVDIWNDLYGPSPDFCGDIDTNCIIVQISAPPPLIMLTDSICQGEDFLIGTNAYNSTGFFIDTLASIGGCDSIVQLDLTVLIPDTTMITTTICNDETYIVGTDTFDVTDMHEVLLSNQYGCDSLVMLDLTVLMPQTTNLTEVICLGDTLWIGTIPYFETGISSDTLLTVSTSCDSIVNLDLTVVELTLTIDEPDSLTCTVGSVDLVSAASTSLGALTYEWSTSTGNFTTPVNIPMVTVDAPGVYYLTISSNNCTLLDSVAVVENIELPTAVAMANPDTLTCAVTTIQLDGTSSTGGDNLSFLWTGNVSDPLSPSPSVTEPAVYTLMVTNQDNGCMDTVDVEIWQNIVDPVADAGPDDTLSCAIPSVFLDGSASTPVGNLSFEWEIVGSGNIIPPFNVVNPQVDAPGVYQLTVTDLDNGCTDLDLVGISNDLTSPQANITIDPPGLLNCINDTVWLDGTNSQNLQDVIVEWSGNIAEGQGTLVAAVIEAGTYSLILTNVITGCADSTTVTVNTDFTTPVADAGLGPDAISCQNTSEDIGGIGSTLGGDITYDWTFSAGGALEPPTNGPFAVAIAPGTYYLTVTNTTSGCTAIDSVFVDDAIEPLDAIVAEDFGELTCDQESFLLDGTNSILAPSGTAINWYNAAGDFLSNELSLEVDYPDSFWLVLEFGECIDSALVVVVEISSAPIADAGSDVFLDCDTGEVILDGSGSESGSMITYEWTSDQGLVISGVTAINPTVSGVGAYVLEVTNQTTACSSLDTVAVLLDTIACTPLADAGADGIVYCSPILTNLQASGSVGPNFSYQWTMLPDSILADMSFNPLVGQGTYVFAVTNDAVGLTAYDTVVVAADTVAPIASVNPFLLTLTCPELADCYALDVTGTSQGLEYNYEWASLDGGFCTPTDELDVEILGAGTYELFVTNTLNGCTAIDNVIIQLADTLVSVDLPDVVQLDCGALDTTLNAVVAPNGGNLDFLWSTSSGDIIAGEQSLVATLNALNTEDVFYFTVTNNINQCTDTDSVSIFAPVNCEPDCGAAVSGVLDCNNNTVTLTATGASTGTDISYQWTALTGNLCGGEMTDTACADAAGIYRLTVSRTYPNGAVFTTFCDVSVEDNSNLPIADAGLDDDLNCIDETLELDGLGSSTGSDIVYLWTATNGGNILNDETTLSPEIDATGTYTLTVTDTLTGCVNTDETIIGEDFNTPDAEAGADQIITCAANTVLLDGSTQINNGLYLWSTNDGDICSNPNFEDVNVCAGGTYYFTVTNTINGCSAIDSVLVEADDDFPVVDVGDDLFYTCVDTVFVIPSVITMPGSGALDFSWSSMNGCFLSPTNILQPTVNCPGTYELTVTDLVNNCSSIASVTVIENTTDPIANAGVTAEINCENLTLALNGENSAPVGQLDYFWTTTTGNIVNGAATANPVVDTAGIYQLLVTDQTNQCVDSTEVLITIDADIPIAAAGVDTSLTCSLTSVNLDGSGSETGADIVYSWSGPGVIDGADGLFPLINEPGAYVLQVADTTNGCIVMDTLQVIWDTLSPDANITTTQTLLINCEVVSLSLNGANSTPIGNVSFEWSTIDGDIQSGQMNPTANIISGGEYILTVTDLSNGCTNQEMITVLEDLEAPFVQVLPASPLTCDSTSVQLTALPPTNQPIFNFEWTGPGMILNENTAMPTVFETGIYRVTITDTTNGCSGDSLVVVTEDRSPPAAIANAIGLLDCDDETAVVSGQGSTVGDVTYQWFTNTNGNISTPNALTAEVDAAGAYFLIVKKVENGCADTAMANVQASAIPIDQALLSFDQPDCLDPEGFIYIDSVLGGTSPYTYSLDDSIFVTYPQFSYLDPGAYDLLIEDVNGCSWTTTVSIFLTNEVLVELGDDLFISQGEGADLEALVNLLPEEISEVNWTNLGDSVDCPTCLNQLVFPVETTTYHIQVFDSTGCWNTDQVTVFVNEEDPFYVPTGFTPNGDNVNDLLLFYAGKSIEEVPSFSIYDRWGNRVFHQENFQPNNPNFGWDGNFQGQPMNPAVFAWRAVVEFIDGKRKVFYGDLTLVR